MLTYEEAVALLSYDPETGLLTWTAGLRRGHVAGCLDSVGRVVVTVHRRIYKAHRLAWLLYHGQWPEVFIDHVDRDPANNRLSNLRPATPATNSRNRKRSATNTSGFKGVHWNKKDRRWRAQVCRGGQYTYLGSFLSREEASAAYETAAAEQHGPFYYRALETQT